MIFSKESNLHGGTVVEGTSRTYKASDLCSVHGMFIDPGYIHDVLLTDLEPSSTYYYSCGVEGVSHGNCATMNNHFPEICIKTIRTITSIDREAPLFNKQMINKLV